jgi:copper chaperone
MTRRYTFQVDGMSCGSCGLLVDDAVEDLPGVRRAKTSARTRTCTVEVEPAGELGDPDAAAKAIALAIGRAGYHAELVRA